MLLPKDSTVFVGIWTLNHDSRVWKDPHVFMPERYEGFDKLASQYAGTADYEKRDKFQPNTALMSGRKLTCVRMFTPLHLRRGSSCLSWNAPRGAQHVENDCKITLGV
jgi:hypothetical protein